VSDVVRVLGCLFMGMVIILGAYIVEAMEEAAHLYKERYD